MNRLLLLLLLFFFLILLGSCTSYQGLLNFNQTPIPKQPQPIVNFQPLTIQPNDILQIRISSADADALRPFVMATGEDVGGADEFLVNQAGEIELPTIGKIMVKGMQEEAIKAVIIEQLSPYFSIPPLVQVRLSNFRVNVNGEVSAPGSINVNNGRLTIIEAITLAGDFTPYSQRDSILIIREKDGLRDFGYVNFYSTDIFSSPYFYLQQNDVVYVRPTKGKVNTVRDPATRALPWVSVGVSVLLLVFTVARN